MAKQRTKQGISLGTFEVVSGVLRISDPCYDKKTWCAGKVDNVMNGTWTARVTKIDEHDGWGNRCRILTARHENYPRTAFKREALPIDVGVDSGQAGIFDDKFYKKDYKTDYLQIGNVEYYHAQSLYSSKDRVALLEAQLFLVKNDPNKQPMVEIYEQMLADAKKLAKNPTPDYSKAQPTRDWYEICCDKTLSSIGAGVIRNGVVSSSGDGDGSYSAYAAYDSNGKVVGVKIKF